MTTWLKWITLNKTSDSKQYPRLPNIHYIVRHPLIMLLTEMVISSITATASRAELSGILHSAIVRWPSKADPWYFMNLFRKCILALLWNTNIINLQQILNSLGWRIKQLQKLCISFEWCLNLNKKSWNKTLCNIIFVYCVICTIIQQNNYFQPIFVRHLKKSVYNSD